MDLVSGNRHRIHVQILKTQAVFPEYLDGVGVEKYSPSSAEFGSLPYRLEDPGFIVRCHHRHQIDGLTLRSLEHRSKVIQTDHPIAIHPQENNIPSSLPQIVGGNQNAGVFDG
jgi:hypothetical protein